MYKNFKDLDLITVYSTMMATSGEISSELRIEIEQRFGMDYFKRIIELRKVHPEEYPRIQNQILSLTSPETDYDFVRKLVSSDFLSSADLDTFVLRAVSEYKTKSLDDAIDRSTITLGVIGSFVGCIPGAIFWWGLMSLTNQPVVLAIPVVFILAFFTIKLLTKKSIKNPVVLIATVVSGLMALCLGHIVYLASHS